MRLKVYFKYFTENNDGLPNRKMDYCIVEVKELNRNAYEFIERKVRDYHKKHHRGCMYYGIVATESM